MGVHVCLEIEVGWDINFVFVCTAPRMERQKVEECNHWNSILEHIEGA